MILAILQARMSSSRLPGKVLEPILGRPMLGRQIDRLRKSKYISRFVLATSESQSDDPVAKFCESEGIAVYRGSLANVLARFHGAMLEYGPAEQIVRLTADCPLADPDVIDACIALHLAGDADYTSNAVERTYPKGLDVEVMRAEVLDRAFSQAHSLYEQEHVTPYIYRHPELFRISNLKQDRNLAHLRWTVDYPADLSMVRAVYEALQKDNPNFRQADILALLEKRPEIGAINSDLM